MLPVKNRKQRQGGLIIFRRCSQAAFFLLFLILFLKTDYNGSDSLSGAVNILFRLDPFLAACVILGAKALVALFLPALFVLLLIFIFGRSFCGWFCPMGTLLDLAGKVLPPRSQGSVTFYPNASRVILVFMLVASIFGWAVAGYLDPFSILVRGLAQALYPWFNWVTTTFFTFTYTQLPDWVNVFTEPLYSVMQKTVLPSEQKYFLLPYLSLFMFLALLLFEGLQRRFFCRNLCPLGALLGVFSKYGFLRGTGGSDQCGKCRICSTNCRMGAIDDQRRIHMQGCNLCFDCVAHCPRQVIWFSYGYKKQMSVGGSDPEALNINPNLTRRQFLGAACAGIVLPSFKRIKGTAVQPDPLVIRPPGALPEDEFKARCVRCAECIQVCIGNALQPTFFQAGLDGMFSPLLVARTGYCEFNCTLCGQVCPSGAIMELEKEAKQRLKIGHAWFDTDLCLPFAKNIPCMVCEEHCPTPEKAIRFKVATVVNSQGRTQTIKQPYIVDDLCIGCGICETKCPLPGRSAIYITSAGEHRHPEQSLPKIPAEGSNYPY